MRFLARTSCWCIFLVASNLSVLAAHAQEVITRNAGESVADFGKRILPPDVGLAHAPLEVAVAPSPHSIVVLFQKTDDVDSNYSGWVLVPADEAQATYKRYVLPPMAEIPGHFDITVEAVFAVNVGANQARDVAILYQYHRTGSTADDGYSSYVYRWNGTSFEVLSETSGKLAGLRTAAAVRRKLRELR